MSEATKVGRVVSLRDLSTVRLVFDGATLETVKQWAQKVGRDFKLGLFTIARLGEKHYQVAYSRKISWQERILIVSWLGSELSGDATRKRFTVRCTKEDEAPRPTIRRRRKPAPRVLYRSPTRARRKSKPVSTAKPKVNATAKTKGNTKAKEVKARPRARA